MFPIDTGAVLIPAFGIFVNLVASVSHHFPKG